MSEQLETKSTNAKITETLESVQSIDSRLDTLTEQMISFESRLNDITDALTTIIDQFTHIMVSATEQIPNNPTLNALKTDGSEN